MKNLTYKGISVMKKTRESSSSQIGLAEKQNLVACLAAMGATHVEITMYSATNAQCVAEGFVPSPLSIEAETQQWYDVIHAQPNVYGSSVFGGYMKVFDRVVFPQGGDNSGPISGFPIDVGYPVGTEASTTDSSWCGRYYVYMQRLVGRLQTGDIQCPWAEITGTAFGGNWGFASNADANTFVVECHKISNAFAAADGATVLFLNNPNFSEISSGYWGSYTDTPPYVCYDYYGGWDNISPVTPEGYINDISTIYAGTSLSGGGIGTAGKPHIWGEWGDLSGSIKLRKGTRTGDNFVVRTTVTEDWMHYWVRFLNAMKQLTDEGKLAGFNYWGGWESQNTSILYKTGSGDSSQYFPNWRGQMLANYFRGDGMTRMPVLSADGTFTEASPSFGGRNMHF